MKMLKQLKALIRSGDRQVSTRSCPDERRQTGKPECQHHRELQLWLELAA